MTSRHAQQTVIWTLCVFCLIVFFACVWYLVKVST